MTLLKEYFRSTRANKPGGASNEVMSHIILISIQAARLALLIDGIRPGCDWDKKELSRSY